MVGAGLVRDGHGGLWSRADVGYLVDWLRCAREDGGRRHQSRVPV